MPSSCSRGRHTYVPLSRSMLQPVNARAASLHVLLAVVTFAEREELHHLAREVFVGMAAAVLHGVELDQHRRVLARPRAAACRSCRSALARSVAFWRYISGGEPHLLLAGGEMVVPEERHPLGQRRRRDQHLAQPPRAQRESFHQLCAAKFLALVLPRRRAMAARASSTSESRGRCWRRGVNDACRRAGDRPPFARQRRECGDLRRAWLRSRYASAARAHRRGRAAYPRLASAWPPAPDRAPRRAGCPQPGLRMRHTPCTR